MVMILSLSDIAILPRVGQRARNGYACPIENPHRLYEEGEMMTQRILEKIITLFTAAVGVVAALAWDDAVKSVFQRCYPFPGRGLEAKFAYAIIVTMVAVLLTSILAKLLSMEEEKNDRLKK